ncbi:hypothetical protein AM629_04530 [Photorhabdus heterorhabditis]|uniref:Type VI secretion system tube protein Hcp n=1 Tax=Photorhabdus heterorhabditis TaxID=880156 RepID=A0ABR5KF77_9GAMM|nr:hypothetical protein AM629_04530 [Photorhabdus heterorhabditis]
MIVLTLLTFNSFAAELKKHNPYPNLTPEQVAEKVNSMGARKIEKEVDSSSPYLYKALTTGQTLKSAELKWYKINEHGQEKEYFNTFMENVKVVNIVPVMLDIKDASKEKFNHMEIVELRYEKITWKHNDGNIIHADSWNETI